MLAFHWSSLQGRQAALAAVRLKDNGNEGTLGWHFLWPAQERIVVAVAAADIVVVVVGVFVAVAGFFVGRRQSRAECAALRRFSCSTAARRVKNCAQKWAFNQATTTRTTKTITATKAAEAAALQAPPFPPSSLWQTPTL